MADSVRMVLSFFLCGANIVVFYEMSVIWTHGAEGSGQFRSLLIYNCKSFTFPHTLIIQLFVISLQNPTDSSAFLQSPFARMAELVDALDSKSNVLKKTCRFEPGFGHKKR